MRKIILRSFRSLKLYAGVIVILTILVRMVYILSPVGSGLDADEAVFGLMAIKIFNIEEFPIFCWQAGYAGAVVSYFGAVVFKIFGIGSIQLKMVMLVMAVLANILWFFVFRKLMDVFSAFISTMLLVYCPFVFLKHTIGIYGGYGETILGMAIIILIVFNLKGENFLKFKFLAITGLISGFFFYILFLILPTIIAYPVTVIGKIHREKRVQNILKFSFFFIIGVIPLIIYNVNTGGKTFFRGAGRSLALKRSDLNNSFIENATFVIKKKSLYLVEWFKDLPGILGGFFLPHQLIVLTQVLGLIIVICFGWYVLKNLRKSKETSIKYINENYLNAIFFLVFILFQWVVGLDPFDIEKFGRQ